MAHLLASEAQLASADGPPFPQKISGFPAHSLVSGDKVACQIVPVLSGCKERQAREEAVTHIPCPELTLSDK